MILQLFLRRLLTLTILAACFGWAATSTSTAASNRPNILFAFADDWGRHAGISLGSAIPSFPLLLRDAGYHLGKSYKVWSPGQPVDAPYGGQQHAYEAAGRQFNQFSQNVTRMVAAGKTVAAAKEQIYKQVRQNFDAFLADRKPDQPFCYWFGPVNVHRKWIKGSGQALWGLNPDELKGKLEEITETTRVTLPDEDAGPTKAWWTMDATLKPHRWPARCRINRARLPHKRAHSVSFEPLRRSRIHQETPCRLTTTNLPDKADRRTHSPPRGS
jgi:hypothetical protein